MYIHQLLGVVEAVEDWPVQLSFLEHDFVMLTAVHFFEVAGIYSPRTKDPVQNTQGLEARQNSELWRRPTWICYLGKHLYICCTPRMYFSLHAGVWTPEETCLGSTTLDTRVLLTRSKTRRLHASRRTRHCFI